MIDPIIKTNEIQTVIPNERRKATDNPKKIMDNEVDLVQISQSPKTQALDTGINDFNSAVSQLTNLTDGMLSSSTEALKTQGNLDWKRVADLLRDE